MVISRRKAPVRYYAKAQWLQRQARIAKARRLTRAFRLSRMYKSPMRKLVKSSNAMGLNFKQHLAFEKSLLKGYSYPYWDQKKYFYYKPWEHYRNFGKFNYYVPSRRR